MAEYVARYDFKGERLADLWTRHSRNYEGSLGRIVDARKYLCGEMQAPLPDAIAKRPDGEAFRVDTARKYTSAMQLINKLTHDVILRRPKTATSDLGERTASRIEKFINPATFSCLSIRDLTELFLIEAEGAALVVPEAARWQKVAGSYYEDDGETIKPSYRRNAAGKAYEDALEDDYEGDEERAKAEFEPDEQRSRHAYDQHIRNLRARNYPFDVELISRQQMVPLNPRVKGANVEVDGILMKTRMAPTEAIRRRYIIDGLDPLMEPKSSTEGDMESGDLWLYQIVSFDLDDDGEKHPYFAYSLAGRPTQIDRSGFEPDAVIDLRKQCGMKSLPVAYGYGWRWFSVDPDKRAMPYTRPFYRSELAMDAFLTGKAYAGWAEGMLAWFMQMPDSITDTAMQQAWMEFVKNNPLTIEPFKILPVWGNVVPAVHPGTGRDVNEMALVLRDSTGSELVSPLARGGGEAGSAIERSVVSADTVAGVSDVQNTVLATAARVGELILEVCAGISHKHGHDVLVYGNPDTPSDQTGAQSATRAIIELKSHWLGPKDEESFDLVAEYPESLGDKLAEKAQLFGFWKEGGITFEDWCKAIGVQDPERYRAQLIFDKWIMNEGMQVAMKDAAAYLGDKELVSMFSAQEQGAAGPQGQPMGMLAGVTPPSGPVGGPVQDPGAQAMTQIQNPAQSQYAAIAGAARNADAANVGPTPAVSGTGMV